MRITGGTFRNRRLTTPKGQEVRPSAGALREALFNILQHDLEGASVLDIFAGSGAIGFEALSRGAMRATFVEMGRPSIQAIRANIEMLKAKDSTSIIALDAHKAVAMLLRKQATFDLIFADPPYDRGHSQKILDAVDKGLLKESGDLFIEEGSEVTLEVDSLNTLTLIKLRHYGRSNLWHFRHD